MRRLALVTAILIFSACGGETAKNQSDNISRQPVSVRGWIDDVDGAKRGETVEIELARRQQMFSQTSIWIENAPYVTGGVSENGGFLMLDVPPGNATIGFNAPGAESATLTLQNIPPNADVLIPGVVLKASGPSSVYDPSKIIVRIPGDVKALTPTGTNAIIGGQTVPVYSAPVSQFTNRREYPHIGGIPAPVAIYK